MPTKGSTESVSKDIAGLRATDPLVHAFSRNLGTVDFDSIDEHIRSLEKAADERDFLRLDEPVAGVSAAEFAREDAEAELGEVGPYVLVRLIGVGGFSRVFEAYHRGRPAERVALKLFQHRWLDALERLEIEKVVLQELRHPNLVRAIDSGETADGLSYLVLAYVPGRRIDDYVRGAKLRPREIAALFAQLADAMAYAHGRDVVHRDLKPNNILVSDAGLPVVADFGLAKRLHLPQGQSVTMSGALVGTLGYLAPEQVHGGRGEITRAVDVYGLGATLYAVLTGRPPTESENLLRGLQQLQNVRPSAPRSLNPDVPLELQLICLKCLEKLPRDRYGSMEELASDLRRFMAGQPVAARAPSAGVQLWRWARANPTIASLVGGILAAIALGLVVSLVLWQRAEVRRLQADALLRSAHTILKSGNRMAENSLGQTAGSLEYRYNRLHQSVLFLQELMAEYPDDRELQRELAVTNFLLAKVCARRAMLEESLEKYELAEVIFRNLSARQPDDLVHRFDIFHSVLGQHDVMEKKATAGYDSELLIESHEMIAAILAAEPDNPKYRDAFLCTFVQLPEKTMGRDYEGRLQEYHVAHAEALKLRSDFSDPCLEWRYAGITATAIAGVLRELGRYEEALSWVEKAVRLHEEFLAREGGDPLERLDLIGIRHEEILLNLAIGDFSGARAVWDDSLELLRRWCREYPDYLDFQRYLSRLELLPLELPELGRNVEELPERTAD